jgi:hypothetical protein
MTTNGGSVTVIYVGAAVMVGVVSLVGGIVWAVGKLVTTTLDHDWRTCTSGCSECKERRKRSVTNNFQGRQNEGVGIYKPRYLDDYVSTAQLVEGDFVELNLFYHQIKSIRVDNKGYMLGVLNLETKMEVIVEVGFHKANVKFWKKLPGQPPRRRHRWHGPS